MSYGALPPSLVSFVGGDHGVWAIDKVTTLIGPPIASAPRLDVRPGGVARDLAAWALKGAISHARYTTKDEAGKLNAKAASLGRPDAVRAALIPIRKSASWWALAQDERRSIYEERSRHTTIGLEYLPRIARRLHHCRDLGEPFDFLTWFEFAPEHEAAFDELLVRLRASEEWTYVDREIDIRVTLTPR